MLSAIKLKISNYLLEKDIKTQNRDSELIILSKAKKIAVLFDAVNEQSGQEVNTLLKYFLKKNIDVDVLGFVNKTKMEDFHLSTLHVNYFNLKHLNLFDIPDSQKTKRFMSKDYDILINLSFNNSFPTRYLTLKSNSKYRIGVFSKKYQFNYDLMFKLKVSSIEYFIKHLISYLELINENNEK